MTVTIGDCELHHGDALALIPRLAPNSIDALICDPPYSSGGMVRGDRMVSTKTKYVLTGSSSHDTMEDFTGDNRDQRGYAYWCALWLGELRAALKPGAVVALFTDWRQLPTTTDVIQAAGYVWRGIVPWHKPSGRPVQGRFSNACEFVVWGTNGPRDLLAIDGSALPGFYQCNSPREREHITEKPLEVMRGLVQIVPPGGTVLDLFMGSGTTGAACIAEGRKFIGCELDDHYFGVAEKRLRAAWENRPRGGEQAGLFS